MDELTLRDVADAVTDVGRVVARQTATLDRLVDDSRAAAARERAGADVPLLVDLAALHRDATACATTARTAKDRAAFASVAAGLERLVVGRGGALTRPAPGTVFDPAVMEAVDTVTTDDQDLDRTVESVRDAGLTLTAAGRSVHPARVVVRRYRG